MNRSILLLTFLAPLVAHAFSDTSPIVAWSTHRSSSLASLPSDGLHLASVVDHILGSDNICDHDVVVLFDQPGLHASDLRTLSPSSGISQALAVATSSRQFPYVRRAAHFDMSELAQSISTRCSSRILHSEPGQADLDLETGKKHVVCVKAQPLEGGSDSRGDRMAEHESLFFDDLKRITTTFPSHFVMVSGSSSPLFEKRQLPSSADPLPHFGSALAPNTTRPAPPKGGILKRYQLLTPALITTLILVLFVIIPVVMLGVSALSSIQSPLRVESPKGYNSQGKKKIAILFV